MGTNQKLTAKQKAERIKAAQDREALGIPTIALSVLSM